MAFRAGGVANKLFQARRLAARPPAGLGEMIIGGKLCARGNRREANEKERANHSGLNTKESFACPGLRHHSVAADSLHESAAPVNSTEHELLIATLRSWNDRRYE